MRILFASALSIVFATSLALADTNRYVLNGQTGMCESTVQKGLQRQSLWIRNIPGISSEFLKANPVCAQAKTCLPNDRMQLLIEKGAFPTALDTHRFLTGSFQKKVKGGCDHQESTNGAAGVADTIEPLLGVLEEPNAAETKMSYALVDRSKKVATDYLQDSVYVMQALQNCLILDVRYSEQASNDQEKLRLYQATRKSNPKTQAGCERLWREGSEIREMAKQLTRMRESLLALNLLRNKAAKNEAALRSLAEDLKSEIVLPNEVLNQQLSPLKGKQLQSPFWEGTPDKLEAANHFEKTHLISYLKDLRRRFPEEEYSIEDALKMDYFSMISESPILTQFNVARPDSKQILAAFQARQEKWKQHSPSKTHIDDIEYLKIPAVLSTVISEMPDNLQGDYCVMAERMIRHHDDKSVENFFTGMALIEIGAAVKMAQGLGRKALAFFSGARISGIPLMSLNMERAVNTYNQQIKNCRASSINSSGFCQVNELDNGYADSRSTALVTAGLALVFGRQMGLTNAASMAAISLMAASGD